ncbi:hypothetical protein HYY70_05870 [Candidatus Woesearchaeota archaeon]|nr:hypothetical protein [Candidatus Woesearchaeota archaeon]
MVFLKNLERMVLKVRPEDLKKFLEIKINVSIQAIGLSVIIATMILLWRLLK